MLSKFGMFCRKLRMERGELLLDMAEKLNVTSSYLSAVEMGKRNIPSNWEAEIVKLYNLSENELEELKNCIKDSIREIRMEVFGRKEQDKEILLKFARSFEEMNDFDKQNILSILNRKGSSSNE